MDTSCTWRDSTLVNTIGHSVGAIFFGLIVALLIRDWRTYGAGRVKLSLLAAFFAFGWNAASLIALALHDLVWIGFIATASFSMLSVLPAVLLQVALRGQQQPLIIGGYTVSAAAIGLHSCELLGSMADLHQAGLTVVVFGFGALVVSAVLLGLMKGQKIPSEGPEWISLGCLLLFTSSFLHFGYEHSHSPWTAEVTWHHIGIPVALIVILRDYRFLLLDTFVRFLVNVSLAAVYIASILLLAHTFQLEKLICFNMFLAGIVLVAFCILLISFASIRCSLQAWVIRRILRRKNVDDCAEAIGKLAMSAHCEEELLAKAGRQIADHFEAECFTVITEPQGGNLMSRPSVIWGVGNSTEVVNGKFRGEAQLPIRFSSGDTRCLIFGPRRGGRKYRSEDLQDMQRLGMAVVEQVERFRAEEIRRLANQAELRSLQAQVNPHFLFNALNTLYGTIDRGSRDARRIVLNLAEIFRYLLQDHRTFIPLSEEIRIVKAYLEIESLRLGNRLETELSICDSAKCTLIPILSIQPLVENAVKHGIAAKREGGRITVKAERVSAGLCISVEDTGVGFEHSLRRGQGGLGVGLENVRRRLLLCYGSSAQLKIQTREEGTNVSLLIPDSCPSQYASTESRAEYNQFIE